MNNSAITKQNTAKAASSRASTIWVIGLVFLWFVGDLIILDRLGGWSVSLEGLGTPLIILSITEYT